MLQPQVKEQGKAIQGRAISKGTVTYWSLLILGGLAFCASIRSSSREYLTDCQFFDQSGALPIATAALLTYSTLLECEIISSSQKGIDTAFDASSRFLH